MNKLTAQQSKMVIEYFSKEAAAEAPGSSTDWADWDKHMWMTCYTASLAIERVINIKDWAALLNAQFDAMLFDRDPAGYLHERGEEDNEHTNNRYHEGLQDITGMWIDMVFNTSKAA